MKKITEEFLRNIVNHLNFSNITMSAAAEMISDSICDTKAFVSYCDFDIIEEFGIDATKKSIVNDIKNDHDIFEETAEWHVCSCGVECKIILIIQAVKKNATRIP